MKEVILYYDYFLSLPGEIAGYWCAGSHTWASIVFLVVRYAAVLGHLPVLFLMFQDPCKTEVRLKFSLASGTLSFSLLLAFVSTYVLHLCPRRCR